MEDYERIEKEKKLRKEFDDFTYRQMKAVRLALLVTFLVIGFSMIIIFAVCFDQIPNPSEVGSLDNPDTMKILSIVFGSLGAFFIIFALVLYATLPKKLNYDNCKKQFLHPSREQSLYFSKIYGRFFIDDEKEKMEDRIKELEDKVARLEDK